MAEDTLKSTVSQNSGFTFTIAPASIDAFVDRLRSMVDEVVAGRLSELVNKHSPRAAAIVDDAAVTPGVELSNETKQKARDLTIGLSPVKDQADRGGLIDMQAVARLLNVAQRTAFRFLSEGAIPTPIRISTKVVRWRADEIFEWIKHGCPPRDEWERMRDVEFSDWPPQRRKRK